MILKLPKEEITTKEIASTARPAFGAGCACASLECLLRMHLGQYLPWMHQKRLILCQLSLVATNKAHQLWVPLWQAHNHSTHVNDHHCLHTGADLQGEQRSSNA